MKRQRVVVFMFDYDEELDHDGDDDEIISYICYALLYRVYPIV